MPTRTWTRQRLASWLHGSGRRATAGLLEWIGRVQDIFYPINETIRTGLLRGTEFRFGESAKGPQEAQPFIQ